MGNAGARNRAHDVAQGPELANDRAVTGVTVVGNRIGTNRAGLVGWGNEVEGILVLGDGNTVGGPTAAHGNLVSGNGHSGVAIDGDGNAVLNNVIGLDSGGTVSIANDSGVTVHGAMNTICAPGQGNTISGNDVTGVELFDGATGNVVQANRIGTRPDGETAARKSYDGIEIRNASIPVRGTPSR